MLYTAFIIIMLLETALRYSLAASLAYQHPSKLAAGDATYARQLAPHLTFAQQITVDDLCASATIFDETNGNGVVVAFRGSTALRNYQSMFNLGLAPSRLGGDSAGRIHRGYQEASLRLYSKLSPILERRSPAHTAFVGHSYGGGTSTICAMMHKPDELVTFAGPRVGDAAFASQFDSVLGSRTTHIVHDLDPVLAQNQLLWDLLGFVHTGQIVRCSSDQPRLLREGEELGGIPLNFADHAQYLGTRMGPV